MHKTRNVLASLPKSAHPGAKKALAEIWNAEDKDHARAAAKTFAAVRLRTHATKGPGSRAAGVGMAFKLIQAAQTHWRRITAPELVPLVRAGVQFKAGVRVDRPDHQSQGVDHTDLGDESPVEAQAA